MYITVWIQYIYSFYIIDTLYHIVTLYCARIHHWGVLRALRSAMAPLGVELTLAEAPMKSWRRQLEDKAAIKKRAANGHNIMIYIYIWYIFER